MTEVDLMMDAVPSENPLDKYAHGYECGGDGQADQVAPY